MKFPAVHSVSVTVRPSSLGLAFLTAAMKHADDKSNPLAEKIGTQIIRNDRPSEPLRSGYNRTMCNNIRVSQRTLNQVYSLTPAAKTLRSCF